MWLLLLFAQQNPAAGGDPTLSIGAAAVYYGIAAPFIVYLLWAIRQKDQERAKVDDRLNNITERLIAQQAETVPLLRDSTEALAAATRELADRPRRDVPPPR